jgi:hypothetical protein
MGAQFITKAIARYRTSRMSALGQTEKNSVRAYIFRFAPQTRTFAMAVGESLMGPTTEVARSFNHLVSLAVSNAVLALPNFYNVAIGIANVAARLAVLGLRLRDELGSSTSPKFITRLNICNADIHKAAD